MAAPSFPSIADQNVVVGTAFTLTVNIGNSPTSCVVEGDWKDNWYYTFNVSTGQVQIKGTPQYLINGEQFTIKATNANGTTPKVVVLNVIPAAPIITRPTRKIKFVKGLDHNLFVPVSNKPTAFEVNSLIIGLERVLEAAGGRIKGTIPSTANFGATTGNMDISSLNDGGADSENNIPFDILTAEPKLGTVTATPAGEGVAMLDFTDITDAFGYEWTLDPADVPEPTWHFFPDSTVNSLNPHDIEITPGNLNVTLTFPQITGALAYEYQLSGQSHWTRFTGTISNSMITTIIPNLEDGVEYDLRLRVASPWIGTPVTVKVYGGRFAYCIHSDNQYSGANDYLYVFHTGVPDGGVATRIKRILLPTGCTNPGGVAISGNLAYVTNGVSNDNVVYVFNHATTTDGNRATVTSKFLKNTVFGTQQMGKIAVYGDKLYIGQRNNGFKVFEFDRNSTNGQQLSNVRNLNLRGSGQSNDYVLSLSVSKDVIFVQQKNTGYIHAYDKNSSLSTVYSDYNFDTDASNSNGTGLCVIGDTFYSVDASDDVLYVFKRNPDDLRESLVIKKFSLPSGLTLPVGLDIPV